MMEQRTHNQYSVFSLKIFQNVRTLIKKLYITIIYFLFFYNYLIK